MGRYRRVTPRHAVSDGAMRPLFLLVLLAVGTTGRAVAGPPFLTDDPVPTDYQHYEVYAFAQVERNAGVATTTAAPAVEFNWGALPNVQVSLSVPYAHLSVPATSMANPQQIPGTTVGGFGDTELGVKYRFLQEVGGRPQISFYPAIEVPTGNKGNGIGNGRAWYRFPLWLQESWGKWTTYGGGGYAINPAPGSTNFAFGGLLVQRDFSENVSVGAELYYQGPQFVGDRPCTLYNAGSFITLTKSFALLFSLGHSFAGDNESVAYFALGWSGALHRGNHLLDAFVPRATPIETILH